MSVFRLAAGICLNGVRPVALHCQPRRLLSSIAARRPSSASASYSSSSLLLLLRPTSLRVGVSPWHTGVRLLSSPSGEEAQTSAAADEQQVDDDADAYDADDDEMRGRDGQAPTRSRSLYEQLLNDNMEYFEQFFEYHNETLAERADDPELRQYLKVLRKRRASRAKLQQAVELRREKRRAKAEANAAKRGPEAQAAFLEERRLEHERIAELKRAPLPDPETLVRSLGLTPADDYWPFLLAQATGIGLNPTWTRLEKRRFLKLTLNRLRADKVSPAALANPPRVDRAELNAKVWHATERFISQSSLDDDLSDVLSDDETSVAAGDDSQQQQGAADDDDDEFSYEQKALEAVRALQQQQQQQQAPSSPSRQPSSSGGSRSPNNSRTGRR